MYPQVNSKQSFLELEAKILKDIKSDLLIFLRNIDNKKNLYMLTKDSCSEISRYIWVKILEKYWNKFQTFIIKGTIKINKKNIIHDVLGFHLNNKIFIIDPTIWQFYPKKRNIVILESEENINKTITKINLIYWYNWKISEYLNLNMINEIPIWIKIIKENINM